MTLLVYLHGRSSSSCLSDHHKFSPGHKWFHSLFDTFRLNQEVERNLLALV